MSTGPKGMVRAAAMFLVGIAVGGMAGCGGGGEEGGIVRPTPPPTTPTPPVTPVLPTPNVKYVGFANGFADADACQGVAAISTNHDSQSAAQDAARRRCQSAGATNCRASWARNGCEAIAAGVNDTGRCALSSGPAITVAEAGSNAQTRCQDVLGPGVLCRVLVSGCASDPISRSVVRWSPPSTALPPPTDGSRPPSDSGPTSDGPNVAAQASDCIDLQRRSSGASAVTVRNNCGFDVEVRSGCSSSGSTALSHPPGTYSLHGGGLYTIRANASAADVFIVICRERGGTPRVAACRKPYTPYFTSRDGSHADCFD